MNRKAALLLIVIVSLGIGLGVLLIKKPAPSVVRESGTAFVANPRPSAVSEDQVSNRSERGSSETIDEYKARMKAELDAEIAKHPDPAYTRYYLEQRRLDRQFDWKQPIDFYGIVIDEKGRPVEGAIADMSWNDLSEKG